MRNSSISEFKLCGLTINIASFSHLLKRVDFNAIVDHLSLTQIIKSKAEPATVQIKEIVRIYQLIFIQLLLHKREGHGVR